MPGQGYGGDFQKYPLNTPTSTKSWRLATRVASLIIGFLWLSKVSIERSHPVRNVKPVQNVAGKRLVFIIPYRNRWVHWRRFQEHFRSVIQPRHPEWTMKFYVIDQHDELPFRRAWLINIGIASAVKELGEDNIDCIVTHDVDMIPDEFVDYSSCETPRQMCTEITKSTSGGPKFAGNIPYQGFAGGVINASPKHWRAINGMSNNGEGYGYEDDVLWNRLCHRDRLVRRSRHFSLGDPLDGNPFTNQSLYDLPQLRRAAKGFGKCRQMDDGGHTPRVKDDFGWRVARREALDLSKRLYDWGSTGLNNTHCKIVNDSFDEDGNVRWIQVEQEREKEAWLNKKTNSKLKDQDNLPTQCPRLQPLDPDWGWNSNIYLWDKRMR